MKKNSIVVQKTANYYTLGDLSPETETVWFFIHGYGQLAEYFLRKFEGFAHSHTLLVAPEGLSRYYLQNDSGRVGASWMTKQSREEEIADQKSYLNNLWEMIRSQAHPDVKLNILAFSQGVATAYRWYALSNIEVANLIFWSGSLPDEKVNRSTSSTSVYFLHGDKDEYLHLMKTKRQLEILRENFVKREYHVFDGKHEINRELLNQYIQRYNW